MVLIREMILMGRFAAGPEGNRGRGRRSAKSPRTSVRRALPVLDHERLLRKQKRGYVVRSYNDQRDRRSSRDHEPSRGGHRGV